MSKILTRRRFLKTTALTGAALGLVEMPSSLAWAAGGSLKILVLGGTGQTGPHLVEELLSRGHTVTLANRGNRSAELFPTLECLVTDRALDKPDGLANLEAAVRSGRTWDLCIDIWPHIPKMVETTADLLKDSVGHFMYVSSLSAYADNSRPGMDETAAVLEAPDADNQEFTMELFGPFKAECENRVRRLFPVNHTIFRPGLIVGPRDRSFRGVYWPVRVARGGEVLAPGDGYTHIQNIDARDLTAFQARCMEQGITGTFNVVGPHPRTPLTMRRLLENCREASGSDARFTWVSAAFLTEHGVGPWMQMPNWIPAEGEYAAFGRRSNRKAIQAGLRFRTPRQTALDTVAWYNSLDAERQAAINTRAGISAEKEKEVLEAWHARRG